MVSGKASRSMRSSGHRFELLGAADVWRCSRCGKTGPSYSLLGSLILGCFFAAWRCKSADVRQVAR